MNITEVEQLDKTESFEMEWKGHIVKFEALANVLTPKFLQDTRDGAQFARAVADTVKKWDVTKDKKGTPWPLIEPELARLPVPFLDALLAKVAESWTGDEKKQKASANG